MNSSKYGIGIVLAALFILAVNIAPAQGKKELTLHGQIIDVTGFTASIQWDAETTRQSALKGNPLGFYDTKDELLYVVTMNNKDATQVNNFLLPYIGERVYVKGTKYMKNGANHIVLSTIWKMRKQKS